MMSWSGRSQVHVQYLRQTVYHQREHTNYERHEVAELKNIFHCERSCLENDGSFASIIHQRVAGGANNAHR